MKTITAQLAAYYFMGMVFFSIFMDKVVPVAFSLQEGEDAQWGQAFVALLSITVVLINFYHIRNLALKKT